MKKPTIKNGKGLVLLELDKKMIDDIFNIGTSKELQYMPFRSIVMMILKKGIDTSFDLPNHSFRIDGIVVKQEKLKLSTKGKK
jgi:hypothetical protein